MLTEPAPGPVYDGPPDPLDVVVLVVPENAAPARIIEVIAEVSTHEHTAVLVVLPRSADPRTRRRLVAAGANHCVIAPRSTELFAHMQQARADARRRHAGDRPDDDPLDALWRSRSARP